MTAAVVFGIVRYFRRPAAAAAAAVAADAKKHSPFGTVLGHAPGNIPVYSCDYQSAQSADWATRWLRFHVPKIWGLYMRLGGWKQWRVGQGCTDVHTLTCSAPSRTVPRLLRSPAHTSHANAFNWRV